jgi:hypothetical protein
MAAVPRASARALKAGVPTGRSKRRRPLAASRARPDSAGSKPSAPPPLSEASLSVHHLDSHHLTVQASGHRRSFRPDSASLKPLPSPRCRLSPCRRTHFFPSPHPFCSPRRTPPAAALLCRLHPELDSAAFLASVRSPSCSLPAPLTRAAMRATLLSSPHNVAPPHRRACAGAWALRSGHLACWAASLPRARAAPGKTMGRMRYASQATLALWPWAACYYATGPRRSRPVGR